jgi:hypothetical protein
LAIEGKWGEIPPISVASPSTGFGILIPITTSGFKVGMAVTLSNNIRTANYIVAYVDHQKITLINDKKTFEDLSDFNPVNNGFIFSSEQPKPVVPIQDQDWNRWENGPILADRNIMVDEFGRFYNLNNPLPIQLAQGSVNIGVVEANVEVQLTHLDNWPEAGRIHDSIRIGDGVNLAKVSVLGEIFVKDETLEGLLQTISDQLPVSLGSKTSNDSLSVVLASDHASLPVTLVDEPIKISGTENGNPNGTEFTFVNNVRLQILSSHDRDQQIVYADFGTKNQRVTQINYSSPTFPGVTAQKLITYTQIGNRYRRDNITWSIL